MTSLVEKSLQVLGYSPFTLLLFSPIIFAVFLIVRFQIRRLSKRKDFAVYVPTPLNERILDKLEQNVGTYTPPWWYNSHLCTLLSIGIDPKLKYVRESFDLPDAHFVVDWYPRLPYDIKDRSDPKICLMFPGLGLTSKNKVAQKIIEVLADAGYVCGVINPRGLEVPLKTSKVWHPGFIEDTKIVIDKLVGALPSCQVYLAGYSAGTNIIHRILTQCDRSDHIKAACCLCINHLYQESKHRLEQSFVGYIYSMLIALTSKQIIYSNMHIAEDIGREVISKLLSCKVMSEFDRLAHKYLYGYECEDDYHEVVSSRANHPKIDIPFLAIQPVDDPLHQGNHRQNIVINDFRENPNAIYLETEYGNHFGFVGGSLLGLIFGTNKQCYVYPSSVMREFFECVHNRNNP